MGFGYRTDTRNSGINRIEEYEQALFQYRNTLPIRRRSPECRPLGHRRHTHFQIVQIPNDGGIGCVSFGNKNYPTIVFKPNGEVVVAGKVRGYASLAECVFIEEVLDMRCKVLHGNVVLSVGGGEYNIPEDGLVIKRKERVAGSLYLPQYEVLNEVKGYTHRLKRKQANIVRSLHSEVLNYLVGAVKLRFEPNQQVCTYDELLECFKSEIHIKGICNLARPSYFHEKEVSDWFALMHSPEPSDNYKGLLMFLHSAVWGTWKQYRTIDVLLREVTASFARLLIAHHKHEVLEKRETPKGEVRKDRYSWAFD